MGLAIGLDTAVKALRAHQLAVDVASHNIANAQSPGFSRQRVLLRPIGVDGSDHFTRDALLGRVGFGVMARDVNRVRDIFLDFQARQTMAARSQSEMLASALKQAELVFNDPTDEGLSGLLSKFWNSWHDVVNDPESPAARTTLVHATETLATRLQRARGELVDQRADLNRQVSSIGDRINASAAEIAQLNLQIKQVELNGDKANDLRDRRDLLLDDLSQIADISYSENQDTSVSVYLGSHELVAGNTFRRVQAIQDLANPGMTKLIFEVDSADVVASTGELRGLLDARDRDLPNLVAKVDRLAAGLIGSVNSLHVSGYGIDNPPSTGLSFFTGSDASDIGLNPALRANPDGIGAASGPNLPGDGSIALAIANLQIAPNMAGGFAATNLVTGETLSAGIIASGLIPGSTLQPGTYFITANGPDIDLRFGSATGPVVGTATLAAIAPGSGSIDFISGTNTVASIRVSNTTAGAYTPAQQQADLVAAGNDTILVEDSATTFYGKIVSVLGADVSAAQGLAESSDLMASHLESLRLSVAGVNLDEEMTNLNASQHAYNAAARVITTIDDMLDTLINRTGVTR